NLDPPAAGPVDLAAEEVDRLDLAHLDARQLDRCARLDVAAEVVVDLERVAEAEGEVAEQEDEPGKQHEAQEDEQADLELDISFAHRSPRKLPGQKPGVSISPEERPAINCSTTGSGEERNSAGAPVCRARPW